MNAEILCVGTELLLGDIVNTNAQVIAQGLASIGVNVFHQSVVSDNSSRLKTALQDALEQCDCIITTGGLGPTYDDLTKETAAGLFGRKMVLDEPSLRRIEAFFARIGRPMTDNNRKQAMMPEGAHILPNENGTAPGLILEQDGKRLVLLPGPPREMRPMFERQVLPILAKLTGKTLLSRSVHIFGVGESAVEDRLRGRMLALQNPTLAPYAKDGEVLLRVTASAENETAAGRLIEPVVREICELFGESVYGVDIGSLQAAVVRALSEKHLTLATAESCTGGLVSKRITEIPGSSAVFHCGVCSYANEIKEKLLGVRHETLEKFGAVSEQTAAEMAAGIRTLSGADVAVSTTGLAGPGGGSPQKPVGLVYVGVSSKNFSTVRRLTLGRGYGDEREYIRTVAASNALFLALQAVRLAAPGQF